MRHDNTAAWLALVGAALHAAPAPASAAVAVVRFAPVESAPDGWLEAEERVLDQLSRRLDAPPLPPSFAANAWSAPGYRYDRARLKVRASLDAAAAKIHGGDPKGALPHLADVADLLALGGLVAVMPASLLRRYHRLDAVARLAARGSGDKQARDAARTYVSLHGLETSEADGSIFAAAGVARGRGGSLAVTGSGIVYLDGVRIGPAPLRVDDLPPGTHYFQVGAPGRVAIGERLEIEAGKVKNKEAYLAVGTNPLRRHVGGLRGDPVPNSVTDALLELAVEIEAMHMLLLVPAVRQGAMLIRAFDVQANTYGGSVLVPFDGDDRQIAEAVERVLGGDSAPTGARLTGSGARPVTATPAKSAASPASAAGASGATSRAAAGAQPPSPLENRWLWIGAAVVVVAVGVGIGVASAGGGELPGAPVYICPAGGPCAP